MQKLSDRLGCGELAELSCFEIWQARSGRARTCIEWNFDIDGQG